MQLYRLRNFIFQLLLHMKMILSMCVEKHSSQVLLKLNYEITMQLHGLLDLILFLVQG